MKRFKLIPMLLVTALLSLSTASAKESEYKVRVDFKYDEIISVDSNTNIVKKGSQYGVVDKNGKTLMKLQSNPLWYPSREEGLITIYKSGKYGFVNRYGKTVISPTWEDAMDFTDGIAIVAKNHKYTFIDTKGKQLFNKYYDYITYFSSGVAPVMNWNPKHITGQIDYCDVIFYAGMSGAGKWGLVNKKGKVIMDLKYDGIHPFIDDGNLFILSVDAKMGFADATGKIITEPILDEVSSFPENMNLCPVRKGSKWGFIDKTGKVVTKFLWGEEPTPIAGTKLWKVVSVSKDYDRFEGIVDDTGKEILETKWPTNGISEFSDGMAAVMNDYDDGFVNEAGELFIQSQYCEVKKFSEGIAWVNGYIPEDNTQFERTVEMDYDLWRPINTSLQYLSNRGWSAASDFKDGCAIVSNDDGKYTVIDKSFNEVFTSNYEIVEVLTSNYFVYKKYDKYGILDKTGKVVIKATFSSCTQTDWFPEGSLARVYNNKWEETKIGFLSTKGKLMGNTYWDSYEPEVCDHFIQVCTKDKWGLLNLSSGTLAVKPQFQELRYLGSEKGESLWMAKKNGKYGIISVKKGE